MQILFTVNNDQSLPVLIDDDDATRCHLFGWYLDTSNGYVRRNQQPAIYLHHFVLGHPPEGLMTDHKDRNKLNNQKHNLHHVTRIINAQNSINTRGELRYIYSNRKTWQVQVRRNGTTYNLGTYPSVEEAKQVRDAFLQTLTD